MKNPQSTAKIAGHPLHPMLIPFPIAFFVATGLCDLAFWYSENPLWVTGSLWLLGAGLAMAGFAAVAGSIDFLGEPRIRNIRAAWLHAGGNITAVLIQIYNFYIRYTDGPDSVLFLGLILSLIVIGMLFFTGWKGWEMVYRNRVGVSSETP